MTLVLCLFTGVVCWILGESHGWNRATRWAKKPEGKPSIDESKITFSYDNVDPKSRP